MVSRLILSLSCGVLVSALAGQHSTQDESAQPAQEDSRNVEGGGERVRKRRKSRTKEDHEAMVKLWRLERQEEADRNVAQQEQQNQMSEGGGERVRKRPRVFTDLEFEGVVNTWLREWNRPEQADCNVAQQQQVQAVVPADGDMFLITKYLELLRQVEDLKRREQELIARAEEERIAYGERVSYAQNRFALKERQELMMRHEKVLRERWQEKQALVRKIKVLKKEVADQKKKFSFFKKEEEKEFSKIRIPREDLPVGHEYRTSLAQRLAQMEAEMEAKIAQEAEMQARLDAKETELAEAQNLRTECAVCYEPFGDDRRRALYGCGHMTVCQECDDDNVYENCPSCRAAIEFRMPVPWDFKVFK